MDQLVVVAIVAVLAAVSWYLWQSNRSRSRRLRAPLDELVVSRGWTSSDGGPWAPSIVVVEGTTGRQEWPFRFSWDTGPSDGGERPVVEVLGVVASRRVGKVTWEARRRADDHDPDAQLVVAAFDRAAASVSGLSVTMATLREGRKNLSFSWISDGAMSTADELGVLVDVFGDLTDQLVQAGAIVRA